MIICSQSLSAGEPLRKRQPNLSDVILRHRMQVAGRKFGNAFGPHARRYRVLLLV